MSNRYPYKRSAGLRSCEYAATLEEVGQALGVSRERARQIENRALTKSQIILSRWGYTLQDLLPDEERHD